jgi:RNA polymerase-binding transcription factor DksA
MLGMTARDRLLAEFRDRLAGARLDLARSVASTDADLEALAAHGSRAIAEDPATGTVGDLLSRLRGRERQQLDEIDAAQARLEAGGFGLCERCREPIHVKRLRATPTIRYCALCQDRSEAN